MPSERGLPSTMLARASIRSGRRLRKPPCESLTHTCARAARECAFDRRVGFERHPAARLFVFAIARARLLRMEHAGDAFDVR